jgi:hypothetical protein
MRCGDKGACRKRDAYTDRNERKQKDVKGIRKRSER